MTEEQWKWLLKGRLKKIENLSDLVKIYRRVRIGCSSPHHRSPVYCRKGELLFFYVNQLQHNWELLRRRHEKRRCGTRRQPTYPEHPTAELPTGSVAFLFTDIEGSTVRRELGSERTVLQALASYDAIVSAGVVFSVDATRCPHVNRARVRSIVCQ